MQTLLLTLGEIGDVKPFVALGCGLQQAGHSVTLVSTANYQQLAETYNLPFVALKNEWLTGLHTGDLPFYQREGWLGTYKRAMREYRDLLEQEWQAAQNADLIIYHPKALGGASIAEKLQIPGILAHTFPAYSPTKEFPTPVMHYEDLGEVMNYFSHVGVIGAGRLMMSGVLNRWRKKTLGLGPQYLNPQLLTSSTLRLYAYSSAFLPDPSDWGHTTRTTGYWRIEPPMGRQVPADVVEFLEAGEPPIYVGFGTMSSPNPAALTQTFVDALEHYGRRAIFATGAGALTRIPASKDFFFIDKVPHEWLFPRVSAVIHHGGAGTTAAGLYAGKPTLICPTLGDQFFWGKRVALARVGPSPIKLSQITTGKLMSAIDLLCRDYRMREQAEALSTILHSEDGVRNAILAIEEYCQSVQHSRLATSAY